jgi:hypothetical protein
MLLTTWAKITTFDLDIISLVLWLLHGGRLDFIFAILRYCTFFVAPVLTNATSFPPRTRKSNVYVWLHTHTINELSSRFRANLTFLDFL